MHAYCEGLAISVQWNLNNPVTYGAVLLGCNKEVAGIQLTATKRSHPFLAQIAALQKYIYIMCTNVYNVYRMYMWQSCVLISYFCVSQELCVAGYTNSCVLSYSYVG